LTRDVLFTSSHPRKGGQGHRTPQADTVLVPIKIAEILQKGVKNLDNNQKGHQYVVIEDMLHSVELKRP
jgi:hypothetical protein